MAANLKVQGLIWPNFEPIQATMVAFVPATMKKIKSKMKVLERSQQ